MRIRALVLYLGCAATLFCQRHHRFSWQDACFNNPSAPYCPGHEFAAKNPKPTKDPSTPDRGVVPAQARMPDYVAPLVMTPGAIDWRFADPEADALLGFNANALGGSPLARNLITQAAASEGIGGAEVQKTLELLPGVQQVAFSERDGRVVIVVTGRGVDAILPPAPTGWKLTTIAGNSLLLGNAEAVDSALQRFGKQGPLNELVSAAQQLQEGSDFWAVGTPKFLGASPSKATMKRFALSLTARDRLSMDAAMEFDRAADPAAIQKWLGITGEATSKDNEVHFTLTLDPDAAAQVFRGLASGVLGQKLSAAVQVARYLPTRDTTVHTKPMIYGLDSGPKEVH